MRSSVVRSLKNDKEMSEVFKLLKVCFPKMKTSYFKRRILGEPSYKRKNAHVLVENGRIVSFVQVYNKYVWYLGKKIKFKGIGAVCTLPKFRGRGYSSMIMKNIMLI